MHHSSQFKILLHLKDIWDLTISFLNNQLIWTYARRDTCFQGTTLPSRIYFVISLTNSYFGSAGKEPTSHPVNIPSLFFLNQHMQKPRNTFCCTRITNHIHTWYTWASNTNHTPKPCPGILIKLGLVFGKGQGCRTWYLCVCLLSQYCILFRLPSGGTVSKKTRKEMGWKQRKRKGTQCDGACPSLIQVQPDTHGHGATAATHGCGHSRKHLLFIYLFRMKAQTTKQNNEWRGGLVWPVLVVIVTSQTLITVWS